MNEECSSAGTEGIFLNLPERFVREARKPDIEGGEPIKTIWNTTEYF
jgi:hypothetical protein